MWYGSCEVQLGVGSAWTKFGGGFIHSIVNLHLLSMNSKVYKDRCTAGGRWRYGGVAWPLGMRGV